MNGQEGSRGEGHSIIEVRILPAQPTSCGLPPGEMAELKQATQREVFWPCRQLLDEEVAEVIESLWREEEKT